MKCRRGYATKQQFEAADRAIERAAINIASELAALLNKTGKCEVGTDYTVERLVVVLVRGHPEILDWLHHQRGEATMRVSVALQNWLTEKGCDGHGKRIVC